MAATEETGEPAPRLESLGYGEIGAGLAIITDKSYRSLGVGLALDATGTSYEVGVFEAEETTTPAATPTKSPTPNATPTPTPASTSSGN